MNIRTSFLNLLFFGRFFLIKNRIPSPETTGSIMAAPVMAENPVGTVDSLVFINQQDSPLPLICPLELEQVTS